MKRRCLQLLLAASVNGVLFMNCSGFKAGAVDLRNLSSVSCKAQLKAVSESSVTSTQCANPMNFSCEKRSFSPFLNNANYADETCGDLNGESLCVSTRTFTFNTEAARSPDSENEFLPGGEFNREDFQCSFNLKNGDFPLFQAQGTSVLNALSHSMEHCRERASL